MVYTNESLQPKESTKIQQVPETQDMAIYLPYNLSKNLIPDLLNEVELFQGGDIIFEYIIIFVITRPNQITRQLLPKIHIF